MCFIMIMFYCALSSLSDIIFNCKRCETLNLYSLSLHKVSYKHIHLKIYLNCTYIIHGFKILQ